MIPEESCKVLVVVESEFDAILLNQEAGHLAGIIALGSAQTRPDKRAADLLRAADLILVSLDSDDNRSDGKNPGAKEAWGWWLKHFEQARRLPPIDGKDPGEMWKAGVDLSEWVRIGIEKYSGQNGKSLDNTLPIQGLISQPLDSIDRFELPSVLEGLYDGKLEDIASRYPDGCHEWVQQNMPDLYKGISSDDDWLNEVWKLCLVGRAAIQDFQSALDIWYEGWMEAIHTTSYHLHQQNQQSLLDPDRL